uniref:Uncharacterized protein n=1 Tax=Meloidogyne floridensis TaxID=298350 RepID=A0A915P9R9_9BILA
MNILIIIYFIFVLIESVKSQACRGQQVECDDRNNKCCRGLNCKNERINKELGLSIFKCYKANCIRDGRNCDDNGRMCCYGSKCDNSVCKKCTINGLKCAKNGDCCSGICNGGVCIPYTPGTGGLPIPGIGG